MATTITFGSGGDYATLKAAFESMPTGTATTDYIFEQVGGELTEVGNIIYSGSLDFTGIYGITIKGNFSDILLSDDCFLSSTAYQWMQTATITNLKYFKFENCSFKITSTRTDGINMFKNEDLKLMLPASTNKFQMHRCRWIVPDPAVGFSVIKPYTTNPGITDFRYDFNLEVSQCLFFGGFYSIVRSYPEPYYNAGYTIDHVTYITTFSGALQAFSADANTRTGPQVLKSSYLVDLNLTGGDKLMVRTGAVPSITHENNTLYDIISSNASDHPDECLYDYSDPTSIYWFAPKQGGALYTAGCSAKLFASDTRYYNGTTYDSDVSNHIRGGNGISVELPTPTGVSATQGTHTDKVVLRWVETLPTSATGYEIYRTSAGSDILNFENIDYLTRVNVGTSAYEDTSAQADVDYWYRIKAYR